MIVAVCADKGSPGVTTTSLALGMVWPGERMVLEADPSGADLPLRLESVGGGPLRQEPSVLSLAADARAGIPAGGIRKYGQDTTVGVPVIPGAMSAEGYLAMRSLWPAVADVAARWSGTVIADLGRLQAGHAAAAVAQAATVVVVLALPTLEGLYHLRDRVNELTRLLGDPARGRTPVSVAVITSAKQQREGIGHVRAMLELMGSPVTIAGAVIDDARTAHALQNAGLDRPKKSPLLTSAAALSGALQAAFPELTGGAPGRDLGGAPPAGAPVDAGPKSSWGGPRRGSGVGP